MRPHRPMVGRLRTWSRAVKGIVSRPHVQPLKDLKIEDHCNPHSPAPGCWVSTGSESKRGHV